MADRVITIAASGGDYTTFPLALAGVTEDFSSTDNLIFRRTDNVRETGAVTVSGYSTTSAHWVILECTSGVQHDGTRASGAGIAGDFGWWSAAITVSIPYVKIQRLEISDSHSTGIGVKAVSTDYVTVDSCLVYDCANKGISYEGEYRRRISANNMIYNCGVGVYGAGGWSTSGDGAYIYNNTILNSGTYGIHKLSYSHVIVKNTYCGASATADNYGEANGSFTFTTCASSDGTISITEIEVADCDFTSSTDGSEDAEIASTSNLVSAGTSLSSDSVYAITTDIFGTSRASTPCIGAFEYVASGGNSYYYQQQQM
jgi:hypothetical protein